MFFNDYPISVIPNVFCWQHCFYLACSILNIVLLSVILKKCSHKTQDLTLKIISVACLVIFIGRWFFGYYNIFNARLMDETDGYSIHTLFPLELCNLGIFFIMLSAFSRHDLWKNFAFFVNTVGAVMALIFNYSHMLPKADTVLTYMFFDCVIIHTQLIAVPIALIACKRFKPQFRYILPSLLMLIALVLINMPISLLLNQIFRTTEFGQKRIANYMYGLTGEGQPILSTLYELIPIPFIYMLPLFPIVFLMLVLMALPFTKKGQRKADFLSQFKLKEIFNELKK